MSAELAHRDAGERGVLAVGAEQPRVVGPAGAQPAGPRPACRRAAGTRGPPRPARSCRSRASCTESARFCLLHAMLLLEQRVAREVDPGVGVPLPAGWRPCRRGRRPGPAARCVSWDARRGHAPVRAGDREPDGGRLVGPERHLPAQLAAGALAEGAVVAGGGARAVGRAHDGRVLRAAVVRPELHGRVGGACARDQRPPSRAASALATGGCPVSRNTRASPRRRSRGRAG